MLFDILVLVFYMFITFYSSSLKLLLSQPELNPFEFEITKIDLFRLNIILSMKRAVAVEVIKCSKLFQNVKFKENIKIKFRAGICTLIISEVTMDDSGEYICKATNDAGQVSTEATVHVKCKTLLFCLFYNFLQNAK